MGNKATLVQLGPLAQLRAGKLLRRLVQLVVGLVFFGVSIALMIRGNLGLAPWDALHVGVAKLLLVSFGWVVVGVSFLVLVLWIPLSEMPGLGTIANAVIIGVVVDFTLQVLVAPETFLWRLLFTIGGVSLCGLGSALYIGAQLGRGPRDGLMTGLHRVTGYSLRAVRTALELSVLLVGLLLAGPAVLGIGTLLFALSIGPLTQVMLPWVLVSLETQA
ncbi:hypothetical protein DNK06_07460 [Pseudomonas daroniae]|uniref:YitT family protein n=2 Tax=Pseudomonadales TaxID=72274 RepID=A0A4Q9QNV7_9GAMM|nr:hypothetical protein [Pseudomonas daroniae]TBU81680.1 hypothetical protein DNK06_07460 [Pseudomonas daroniae]TBU84392.1 hypothetical protein DNK31_07715 [Pseudomonas sp. FRB 228]TBU88610.1 hypothetical protein DNJ99_18825 [Pseudomonas daroniae]